MWWMLWSVDGFDGEWKSTGVSLDRSTSVLPLLVVIVIELVARGGDCRWWELDASVPGCCWSMFVMVTLFETLGSGFVVVSLASTAVIVRPPVAKFGGSEWAPPFDGTSVNLGSVFGGVIDGGLLAADGTTGFGTFGGDELFDFEGFLAEFGSLGGWLLEFLSFLWEVEGPDVAAVLVLSAVFLSFGFLCLDEKKID